MITKHILFVCVHNAGRSQMAEALFNQRAQQRGLSHRARSAGTLGGTAVNPTVMQALTEQGVPVEGQYPKVLSQEMVDEADRVITMGCDVSAEACPARFLVTEDWGLDDPKGRPIEEVRVIRDEIARRVDLLLDGLEAR